MQTYVSTLLGISVGVLSTEKRGFFRKNPPIPYTWKSFPLNNGVVIHNFVCITVDNPFLSPFIHIFRGFFQYAYILHAFIIVFFDTPRRGSTRSKKYIVDKF